MKFQKNLSAKYFQNILIKSLIAFNVLGFSSMAATKSIVVAGGCFWCMEGPFDKLDGVLKTTSGYSGGHIKDPSYEVVSRGTSGHLEVVEIQYEDTKIKLEKILETFWRNIDPTDGGGQFVDRGEQYTSAIFYSSEIEKTIITESLKIHQKYFKKPIVTKILKFEKFYAAEEYHQDYYKKNPIRYKFYRHNSGRDQFLNANKF